MYDIQLWQISIERSFAGLRVEDVTLAITKIETEDFLQIQKNRAILYRHSRQPSHPKRLETWPYWPEAVFGYKCHMSRLVMPALSYGYTLVRRVQSSRVSE